MTARYVTLPIEDTVSSILADVGYSQPLPRQQFDKLCNLLSTMHNIVVAEDDMRSVMGRSELNRNVDTVRNATKTLLSRLRRHEVASLLNAGDRSYATLAIKRGLKEQHVPRIDLMDLVSSLEHIEEILSHVLARQKEFDALNQDTQFSWRFEGSSSLERQANADLFRHFRPQALDKPEHYAVRFIAQVYFWLFGKNFKINSVKERKGLISSEKSSGLKFAENNSGLRYGGPSLRFAHSVITRLQLSEVFGASDSIELSNKIGDLWINDERRQRKKPLFGF